VKGYKFLKNYKLDVYLDYCAMLANRLALLMRYAAAHHFRGVIKFGDLGRSSY
jgi:hypothetical protein